MLYAVHYTANPLRRFHIAMYVHIIISGDISSLFEHDH